MNQNYETFEAKVVEYVCTHIDEGVSAEITEVTKNNGVVLKGLALKEDDSSISPTVYLERYYDAYEGGRSIESIGEEIIEVYHKGNLGEFFDVTDFLDFEKAKKRIVYKLVNYEKNKVLLKQIPHKPFLDMAVVYYYLLENEQLDNATILIYNNHLESWNTTAKEIDEIAALNTPLLLKEDLHSITEVLYQIMKKRNEEEAAKLLELENEEEGDPVMYVLSNRNKIFGAAAILYSGVLKAFSDKLKKDLFILPSSVHEVILIPKDETMEWEKLQEMVQEVNSTQVEDVEILSDSVYCYQRNKDSLLPAWQVA